MPILETADLSGLAWSGFRRAFEKTGRVFWRGVAPAGLVDHYPKIDATLSKGILSRGFHCRRDRTIFASPSREQAFNYAADDTERLRIVIPDDTTFVMQGRHSGDMMNVLSHWMWLDALDAVPEHRKRLLDVVADAGGELYILEIYLKRGIHGLARLITGEFLDRCDLREASAGDAAALIPILAHDHEVWFSGRCAVLTIAAAAAALGVSPQDIHPAGLGGIDKEQCDVSA